MTEIAPTLPGLDGDGREWPPLTAAVRRTFAALDAAGVLGEHHAGLMAQALYLAEAMTACRGRGSSIALLSRELRETLALLPAPEVTTADDDAWSDFEASLRSAAQLGDTAQP